MDHRLTLGAGILVVLGLAAGLASVTPAIDSQDYMTAAPTASAQVKLAVIAQLGMALAYLCFAAILYPSLRRHGPELAVVFLGGRLASAALTVTSTAVMLALLTLSEEAEALGPSALPLLSALGNVLRLTRDQLNHVFMIVLFGLGNAAFYVLARRAGVVPRWLATWGVLGIVFAVLASLLFFFGAFEIISTSYLALNIPAVTSEFLLAFWLIFNGLKQRRSGGRPPANNKPASS